MIEPSGLDQESESDDQNTRSLILQQAISLFASRGFSGVSMRDLASAVNITPGALYYHFPNKQSLHVAAVCYAYRERSEPAVNRLKDETVNPWERLRRFILRLCERFHGDPEFRMLVQRCMMDCDDEIRQVLLDHVYRHHFRALEDFLAELAPDYDRHLLTVSIFGLIMHTYNTASLRRSFPGYSPEQDRPEVVAEHIMKLLMHGILPPE